MPDGTRFESCVLMRINPPGRLLATIFAVAVLGSACGGGASDVVGQANQAAVSTTNLNLVAYSVPKVGFEPVIAAFGQTVAGKGVSFSQSYGASGDQSRKVAAGAPADVVNFSAAPDVTRLVDAGIVDPGWSANGHHGVAFGSVVVMVVRKGNPKHIKDWPDLLQAGVEVVTPNPLSSGSAKWNLLAPYAVASKGGVDDAAGISYVRALVSDHVHTQPASGAEATQTFLGGTGDVLLSYENEAIATERQNAPVEHVIPPATLAIENPIAVTKTSAHPEQARAFVDYQYTPAAQELWAAAGFRPVDATVASKHARDFPTPGKLWTIDDLGGWAKVDPTFFDKATGSISRIYTAGGR
jgi:sulfate/thiosulfate-binding protein